MGSYFLFSSPFFISSGIFSTTIFLSNTSGIPIICYSFWYCPTSLWGSVHFLKIFSLSVLLVGRFLLFSLQVHGFFPLSSPFCYWTIQWLYFRVYFLVIKCVLKNSFYFLLTIPYFSFISNVFFFNFRESSYNSCFRVSVRIISTSVSSQGCLSLGSWVTFSWFFIK